MRLAIAISSLLIAACTFSCSAAELILLSKSGSTAYPTGITADGRYVIFHRNLGAGSRIFLWHDGVVSEIGAGSSAGITYQNGQLVAAGNITGVGPSKWVNGVWTPLPLVGGTATWTAYCIAATPTDIIIGGNTPLTVAGKTLRQVCRYRDSVGTTDLIPVPADAAHPFSFMVFSAVSENGMFAVLQQAAGQMPYPYGISPATKGGNACAGPDTGLTWMQYLYYFECEEPLYPESWGIGINRTGSRMVGMSTSGYWEDYTPCYWDAPYNANTECHALPLPAYEERPSRQGTAEVVSDDGKVMAGWVWSPSDKYKEDYQYPCIWLTQEDGSIVARDLELYANSLGLNANNLRFRDVWAISADGKTLCGKGVYMYPGNPFNVGWIIKLDGSISGGFGTTNRALFDPVTAKVASRQRIITWGRVGSVDSNYFTLDDGSGTPVKVFCPIWESVIQPGSFARAQGIWHPDTQVLNSSVVGDVTAL